MIPLRHFGVPPGVFRPVLAEIKPFGLQSRGETIDRGFHDGSADLVILIDWRHGGDDLPRARDAVDAGSDPPIEPRRMEEPVRLKAGAARLRPGANHARQSVRRRPWEFRALLRQERVRCRRIPHPRGVNLNRKGAARLRPCVSFPSSNHEIPPAPPRSRRRIAAGGFRPNHVPRQPRSHRRVCRRGTAAAQGRQMGLPDRRGGGVLADRGRRRGLRRQRRQAALCRRSRDREGEVEVRHRRTGALHAGRRRGTRLCRKLRRGLLRRRRRHGQREVAVRHARRKEIRGQGIARMPPARPDHGRFLGSVPLLARGDGRRGLRRLRRRQLLRARRRDRPVEMEVRDQGRRPLVAGGRGWRGLFRKLGHLPVRGGRQRPARRNGSSRRARIR